jgi:hypothetical protein
MQVCTVEIRPFGTTNLCKTKSFRCQNGDTRLYGGKEDTQHVCGPLTMPV